MDCETYSNCGLCMVIMNALLREVESREGPGASSLLSCTPCRGAGFGAPLRHLLRHHQRLLQDLLWPAMRRFVFCKIFYVWRVRFCKICYLWRRLLRDLLCLGRRILQDLLCLGCAFLHDILSLALRRVVFCRSSMTLLWLSQGAQRSGTGYVAAVPPRAEVRRGYLQTVPRLCRMPPRAEVADTPAADYVACRLALRLLTHLPLPCDVVDDDSYHEVAEQNKKKKAAIHTSTRINPRANFIIISIII